MDPRYLQSVVLAADDVATPMLLSARRKKEPTMNEEDQYNPVSDSDFQNFRAAYGRGAVKLGRGAKQLLDIPAQALEGLFDPAGRLSGKLGMPTAAQSAEGTRQDEIESRRLDAPLMDTKAGMAGDLASNIVNYTPAMMIPGVGSLRGAAAFGGGAGALEPTVDQGERMMNIGSGAALAGGAQYGLNKAGALVKALRGAKPSAATVAPELAEQQVLSETLRSPMHSQAGYSTPKMLAALALLTSGGYGASRLFSKKKEPAAPLGAERTTAAAFQQRQEAMDAVNEELARQNRPPQDNAATRMLNKRIEDAGG
jgi:hypothetical protein